MQQTHVEPEYSQFISLFTNSLCVILKASFIYYKISESCLSLNTLVKFFGNIFLINYDT